MITLDQLKSLVVLSEQGSFTKTANALHKAQSAVTYTIKSLETELGLRLLDRSGYRAKFTPEGESILKKAKSMLELEQEIKKYSAALKEGWEPRINIVTHAILPIENIMPHLKESLSLEFPTQLTMHVEILSGITERIETLQPEIVLTPLVSAEIPRNYNVVHIGSISLIPTVSSDHPLGKAEFPIPLHELRKHVHLIVSDSARSPKPMDFLLVGAQEQWKFPDFFSRREGLRAGMGFAWMPTYLIEKDIASGALQPIILEGQNVYNYEIGIIYRQSPVLGPAGNFLLDQLKQSKQLLPDAPEDLLAIYTRNF